MSLLPSLTDEQLNEGSAVENGIWSDYESSDKRGQAKVGFNPGG